MPVVDQDKRDGVVIPFRRPTTSFEAAQLHFERERSWAVIAWPSGAIALDARERLLMKLTERDARGLAATMTSSLRDGPGNLTAVDGSTK